VRTGFLQRSAKGTTLRVPIDYDGNAAAFVNPTVLRSICAAFDVDPAAFGFILG
jgi:hypothetical protein